MSHNEMIRGVTPEEEVYTKNNFTLLEPMEFVCEFCQGSVRARERLYLQSMYFLPSHATNLLFHSLEQCARKGVPTILHNDGLQSLQRDRQLVASVSDAYPLLSYDTAFEQLNAAGVAVRAISPLKRVDYPKFYRGRDHRKFAVVDQTAYVGDMNFGREPEFNRISNMVRVSEPAMVECLADQFHNPVDTARLDFDSGTLLFDGGTPGESIILEEACALLRETRQDDRVHLMTPWVPDGPFLKELNAAIDRNVQVAIGVSGQSFTLSFEGLFALVKKYKKWQNAMFGTRLPAMTLYPREVHSKFLMIQTPDTKTLLMTSHNFTQLGVRAGTRELALETHDERLCKQFEEFFDRNQGSNVA